MKNEKIDEIKSYSMGISTSSVSDLLDSFKLEMQKMEALSENLNKETSNIKNEWQGNASDSTLARAEEFKSKFESIKEQNEKYVSSLYKFIEMYSESETSNIGFINSNIDSYDIINKRED